MNSDKVNPEKFGHLPYFITLKYLLTNPSVFENISLVKIECLLCFFVFIVSILHTDFNLQNKA